jgi:DNA-binding response OmpR family regulator
MLNILFLPYCWLSWLLLLYTSSFFFTEEARRGSKNEMEKNRYERIKKKYSRLVSVNQRTNRREIEKKKKHEEREKERRLKGYCFAIYVNIDTLYNK